MIVFMDPVNLLKRAGGAHTLVSGPLGDASQSLDRSSSASNEHNTIKIEFFWEFGSI
jgi:hypothetical protein